MIELFYEVTWDVSDFDNVRDLAMNSTQPFVLGNSYP